MSEIVRRKRTEQHINGDRAMNEIERIVLDRGFAMDRSVTDYGTDFTLHVFSDDFEYVGFLIGQCRAKSGLRPKKDGTFALSVDVGHLNQWLSEVVPFLLVLYDVDRRAAYWFYVQAHRDEVGTRLARRKPGQASVIVAFDPGKRIDREALDGFRRWVRKNQEQATTLLEYREDV